MIKKLLINIIIGILLINIFFGNPFNFLRLYIIILTLLILYSKNWFLLVFLSLILDFYLKKFIFFGTLTIYTLISKTFIQNFLKRFFNLNLYLTKILIFNLLYFLYILILILESKISTDINFYFNFKSEIFSYILSFLGFLIIIYLIERLKNLIHYAKSIYNYR